MQNAGKPEPEFYDDGLEFKVILRKAKKNNGIDSLDIKEAEKKEENAHSGSVLDKAAMLLEFCGTPKFRQEIADYLNVGYFYVARKYIKPLLEVGKLKLTIPDKPQDKDQKFVQA